MAIKNQWSSVIFKKKIVLQSKPVNSPVLQSPRPRVVDSGEAKMRTASWENVDKQMPRKIRNDT